MGFVTMQAGNYQISLYGEVKTIHQLPIEYVDNGFEINLDLYANPNTIDKTPEEIIAAYRAGRKLSFVNRYQASNGAVTQFYPISSLYFKVPDSFVIGIVDGNTLHRITYENGEMTIE